MIPPFSAKSLNQFLPPLAIALAVSFGGCSRESTGSGGGADSSAANREAAVKDVASAHAPKQEEWWKNTGHPGGKWWLEYPGYDAANAEKIWEHVPIPPSPVLSAEEALGTFKLPDGLRIELVAAEPLIVRPVFMKFDAAGRLWVVEMPGYMRDIDGGGEDDASGRVVVLEDLDGDGRMDKATTFLDRLVMPRTLAFVEGGVLVVEPPRIWYARDLDGDLVCDEKTLVASDYGVADNPEHSANGLLHAMDNWMYSAKSAMRYRFSKGKLESEPTLFRGQWGITQDDAGWLYYNYNQSPLHTELVAGSYAIGTGGVDVAKRRNILGGKMPVNLPIANDPSLHPARVTPLVTLGASDLRPDGTLKKFTSACAPLIYRGDALGEEYRGNSFVCDPVGNLVSLLVFKGVRPDLVAERAYPDTEFLTSTDERFRPVALEDGPDGALYLADMYTGIVEHKRYVTEYLRKQVLSRDMDRFTATGRIYRIVPATRTRVKPVTLAGLTSAELVEALGSAKGWVRDTAQRLLVERRDPAAPALLKAAAATAASPLARLHALWTCEGLGGLDLAVVRNAMRDADQRVRAAGVRLSEGFLSGESAVLRDDYRAMRDETAGEVRLQLILSLSRSSQPWAVERVTDLLWQPSDWWYSPVVAAAFNGRELEFFTHLLRDGRWSAADPDRARILQQLGMSMIQHSEADRVEKFLDLLGDRSREDWRVAAALAGATSIRRAGPAIRIARAPALIEALASSSVPEDRRMAGVLRTHVRWGTGSEPEVPPLTEAEMALFEIGRAAYASVCAACHQPNGQGLQGVAPSLVGTPWVLGPPQVPAGIVIQGVTGVIEVHGEKWSLAMPGLGSVFDDEKVAGILTYIRRQWGNEASAVSVAEVAAHRQATSQRQAPWTMEELRQMAAPATGSAGKK